MFICPRVVCALFWCRRFVSAIWRFKAEVWIHEPCRTEITSGGLNGPEVQDADINPSSDHRGRLLFEWSACLALRTIICWGRKAAKKHDLYPVVLWICTMNVLSHFESDQQTQISKTIQRSTEKTWRPINMFQEFVPVCIARRVAWQELECCRLTSPSYQPRDSCSKTTAPVSEK